jgi:hypothetical protein
VRLADFDVQRVRAPARRAEVRSVGTERREFALVYAPLTGRDRVHVLARRHESDISAIQYKACETDHDDPLRAFSAMHFASVQWSPHGHA